MGKPVVDSQHVAMEGLVRKITHLCFSPEFGSLRSELERLYGRQGYDKPARQAFQDALYTLMVQEEIEDYKVKLLE